MNFLHAPEQLLLKDAVGGALAHASPEQVIPTLAELGVFAALMPEAQGGTGLGVVEGAIILEAAGRAGLDYPLAATIAMAGPVSALRPHDIDSIARGHAPIDIAASGCLANEGGRLRGRLTARNLGRLRWLVAPLVEGGFILLEAMALSGTPRVPVEIGECPVSIICDLPAEEHPVLTLAGHADAIAVLHCAELLGAAAHLFDLSLAYLKDREQFGQPIGTNQALKHMAADAYMMLESIRVAVEYAAAALDAARVRPDDSALAMQAERAVKVMHGYVPQTARHIAETAVQFHGGIGLTWEYQLNGYLRRIIRIGMRLGHGAKHRSALLDLLQRKHDDNNARACAAILGRTPQ